MDDGAFGREFKASDDSLESLDVSIESPALRRLIEEVRAEAFEVPRSYNRTFNRHNR
jgi:hypothetical protein